MQTISLLKQFLLYQADSENSSSQCTINITTKNKKIVYISFCEYKTEIFYKKEKHFQIYFKHKHDFVIQPDKSLFRPVHVLLFRFHPDFILILF